MKQFLKYILVLLLSCLVILVVLDSLYTYIYAHPRYKRSKVSMLKLLDKNDSYDYAVFGSSRVHFNLDVLSIYKRTGIKGVNLGYPGSNNFEINLMVKLFLRDHRVNSIFIQVDNQYNKTHNDPIAVIPFIPFIRDSIIYTNLQRVLPNAAALKYVPFYRYIRYDSKLGFRELIMSFYKNNLFEHQLGFAEPSTKSNKHKEKTFEYQISADSNIWIEEIIDLCKEKNIEIYFYTAPIYKSVGNLDDLNVVLPHYTNFSSTITDPDKFQDYYHLNKEGTRDFSELFADYYFKNKN